MKSTVYKSGFTLIELMVVVAIMGILVSLISQLCMWQKNPKIGVIGGGWFFPEIVEYGLREGDANAVWFSDIYTIPGKLDCLIMGEIGISNFIWEKWFECVKISGFIYIQQFNPRKNMGPIELIIEWFKERNDQWYLAYTPKMTNGQSVVFSRSLPGVANQALIARRNAIPIIKENISQKEWIRSPFVLIVGPPRCGTSLCAELVKTCGYNVATGHFGDNPRDGRHEHGKWSHNYISEQNVDEMMHGLYSDKATALKKMVQFFEWTGILNTQFADLRVVVATRKVETAALSNIDYVFNWENEWTEDKRKLQRKLMNSMSVYARDIDAAVNLINDASIKTYEVPWERAIRKDKALLVGLHGFLGAQCELGDLDECINTKTAKFKYPMKMDWNMPGETLEYTDYYPTE